MANELILDHILDKHLTDAPTIDISDTVLTEVILGSHAFGVTTDTSDYDVYGVFVPAPEDMFTNQSGEIKGFGYVHPVMDTWVRPHVADPERNTSYDVTYRSLPNFMNMLVKSNDSAVNTLFSAPDMINFEHSSMQYLRDNREKFLTANFVKTLIAMSKGSAKKIHKVRIGENSHSDIVRQYGYDTKLAANAVRLALFAKQILDTGTLVLDKDKELVLSVKTGGYTKTGFDNLMVPLWYDLDTRALPCVNIKMSDVRNMLMHMIMLVYPNIGFGEYGIPETI